MTGRRRPLRARADRGPGAWWQSRLDGFGPPGSVTREIPLAAAVTLLTVALLIFEFGYAFPVQGEPVDPALVWTVGALACLQSLVLVLRRQYPIASFAAVVVVQLVLVTVPDFTLRGPALVVAAYTLGTLWSARRVQLGVGLAVLAEVLLTLVFPPNSPNVVLATISNGLGALATYGIPALAGAAVATRGRYTRLLAERAADAVAAQRATVQAALAAERARMARELHDVAAHHLSGMVVQAAAVERLVERDPVAARAGAAWIRTQGRKTLDNLRMTVGVLRETAGPADADADAAERTPTPGLAELGDLVETARELGMTVTVTCRGARRELPPIADIACFRVAQEALSNARLYAPGAEVAVLVEYTPEAVLLEITDVGAPRTARPRRSGTGVGLVGMRERADLIGAEFSAGSTATGGWRVRLRVPVAEIDRLPLRSPHQEAGA